MIVIGNTLVLTAISVSGKRRSRMNFFIINLACADLGVGCVLVLSDIIWKTTITWYAGNIGYLGVGCVLVLSDIIWKTTITWYAGYIGYLGVGCVLVLSDIIWKTTITWYAGNIGYLGVGCVLVLSDIIWKTTITWYAGNIGCKLVKFSQCSATYGATYALVVLSIDRLDAIARPMHMTGIERRCRILVTSAWSFAALFSLPMVFIYKRRCRILVTLAWSFAALFSLPMVFIYNEKEVEGVTQCWMELPEMWMWQLYVTSISFAVFIIPAVIIATCYILIVIIIWKSSMKFNASSAPRCSQRTVCLPQNGAVKVRFTDQYKSNTNTMSGSSSRGVIPKAKIKTIKMTFVIVLAFILCWSPYFIWDLLHVYGYISYSQQIIAISTFVQSLAPLNSAANPLIYTLFNTVICRRMFKRHNTYHSPPNSHAAPLTSSTPL